jgi:Vps16, N-terminal region
MAKPTADWEKVGDKFYRKIQLYTAIFDQDLELENYVVTGSPYAGAIGMLTYFLRRRCFSALSGVHVELSETCDSRLLSLY